MFLSCKIRFNCYALCVTKITHYFNVLILRIDEKIVYLPIGKIDYQKRRI